MCFFIKGLAEKVAKTTYVGLWDFIHRSLFSCVFLEKDSGCREQTLSSKSQHGNELRSVRTGDRHPSSAGGCKRTQTYWTSYLIEVPGLRQDCIFSPPVNDTLLV